MITSFSEPTLAELLNDPGTRALMQADNVNPRELEETLRCIARLRRVSTPPGEICWSALHMSAFGV